MPAAPSGPSQAAREDVTFDSVAQLNTRDLGGKQSRAMPWTLVRDRWVVPPLARTLLAANCYGSVSVTSKATTASVALSITMSADPPLHVA